MLIPTHPPSYKPRVLLYSVYSTHTLPQSATANRKDTYTVMKQQVPVWLLYIDGFLIILTLSDWKLISQEKNTVTRILLSWRNALHKCKVKETKTDIAFETKYTKLTHCGLVIFRLFNHKSLIQRKVAIFFKIWPGGPFYVRSMYSVIKCVKKQARVKRQFCVIRNIYDAKTQMTRILVTGPQCVNTTITVPDKNKSPVSMLWGTNHSLKCVTGTIWNVSCNHCVSGWLN
jgi:hypothetical protein